MKTLIIADEDFKTDTFHDLNEIIHGLLNDRGFETEVIEVGLQDLTFCKGCFSCWVKKPGECVMKDAASINRSFLNSDVTVYLSPVIFGQFSANIKNVIDRSLPNMLPFFYTRPDGSTAHPPRYDNYPRQIIIGYGEEISTEDRQLFLDITKKHRYNIDVLLYGGHHDDRNIIEAFNQINLAKIGDLS